MTDYVRYIEKTRDYYPSQGYDKPYQCAHFDAVPFAPLPKPLAQCRVTLVSTSEISIRGLQVEDETQMGIVGGAYTIPSDLPAVQLYSPSHSFDQAVTTLEDGDAFVPRTTLQTPYRWSQREQWKVLVFTPEQPWETGEVEQDWLRKKEIYKKRYYSGSELTPESLSHALGIV